MQLEWMMTEGCKKFNIRAALVNILGKNRMVDTRMYIKSSITNSMWREITDIPTGEEFSNAFNVQQEHMGNCPPKVRMYLTIFSHLKLNTIKFDNTVYNHLCHHDVYLCLDHFKQNNMVSLGFVVDIHLGLA
eukprot:5278935-Ditylum_brightwellii.AAC.1